MDLEVVTIARATGVFGGEVLNQIVFGKVGTATQKSPMPEGSKVVANYVTIFLPADKELPYTFGSKWRMNVDDQGNISIKKL
jgi:hypothetical protein